MKPTLAPLLLAVLPFAALWPQDPATTDVRSLLADRLRTAPTLELDAVWEEASRLAELSLDLEEAELERAIDELLGQEGLAPRAALLLVATRLEGDDPDYDALTRTLMPLLQSEDEEVVRGAAGLLSDSEFLRADPTDRKSVV